MIDDVFIKDTVVQISVTFIVNSHISICIAFGNASQCTLTVGSQCTVSFTKIKLYLTLHLHSVNVIYYFNHTLLFAFMLNIQYLKIIAVSIVFWLIFRNKSGVKANQPIMEHTVQTHHMNRTRSHVRIEANMLVCTCIHYSHEDPFSFVVIILPCTFKY